jgi:hypothetical protein
MHIDWRWFAFACVCGVLFSVLHFFKRRREQREENRLRIWQLCRYQGGGKIYTPSPMHEEDAIEFASNLGSVLWIDREHGFIFYRPTSG